MKFLLAFAVFLSVAYVSCENSSKKSNTVSYEKKEMLVSDTAEGWGGDVILSIVKIQDEQSGEKILTAVSSYKGKDVGFEIRLTPQKDKNVFHTTGIEIKSLGEISDNFLHVLTTIYQVKDSANMKFIKSISSTYTDLGELAGNKNKGIKTKLFLGDSNDENDYGEVYLNIYEQERRVELAEKDIEYRAAVIKAFKQKASNAVATP